MLFRSNGIKTRDKVARNPQTSIERKMWVSNPVRGRSTFSISILP